MSYESSSTLFDDLYLISTRGLPESLLPLLRAVRPERSLLELSPVQRMRWVMRQRNALGLGKQVAAIAWPEPQSIHKRMKFFVDRQIKIVWNTDALYPRRLLEDFGARAPAWLFVWGKAERLGMTQCAVIGSRESPKGLCRAAERLGEALANSGIVVTSGMAAGADSAAHLGAAGGSAGTIGIPAQGIFNASSELGKFPSGSITMIGIGRPDERFHAGLAIRRNHVIASLAQGLVLVASRMRGGSAYALGWGLRRRRQIWCFESDRNTPSGNRSLLRSGLAQPLRISCMPEDWAESIHRGLKSTDSLAQASATRISQLDWLA